MIVISAAAVAIAILLLVVGMITSNLVFVYISIGVSVAAAILLAVGVFRRRELFVREAPAKTGAAAGEAAAAGGADMGARAADSRSADSRSADARAGSQQVAMAGEQTAGGDVAAAERTSARVLAGAGQGAFRTSLSAAASAPPDSDIVLVVPGRRRFHVPGCIRLTGRLTEKLTVNEAVEEGFTACTTCLPGSVPGAWATGQDAAATFTAATPEPAAWVSRVAMPPAPDSGEPAAQPPWRVTMAPAASAAADTVDADTVDADTVDAEPAKPEPAKPEPAEPAPAEPEAAEPEAAEPEPVEPEPVEPAAVDPEAVTCAAEADGPGEPAKPAGAAVHQDGAGQNREHLSEPPVGALWPGTEVDLSAALPDAGEDFRAHAAPGAADETPAGADAHTPETATANAGDPTETVWVLRGVSRYHLRDCVLIVDHDDVDAMTLAEAETDGCTPCRACHTD